MALCIPIIVFILIFHDLETFLYKEPLNEGERGECKSWFKTQHSKNEDPGIRFHHFMANRLGNNANSDFIFLGSKITADGDCSYKIKRCLLLGRKAMTNQDTILKIRGVTLLTKVLWGCRIVWCILTSRYLVSFLRVSIIHVSDIFLVGFWSWEISFIMWGCRGWGWQAAGTWVSVSREMVGFPWNGGIPRPHRVTWSQPINMHPVKACERAEKTAGA